MRSERGQATIEWTGALLVVAFVFLTAVALAPAIGIGAAPGFARSIRCAVLRGCHGEDARLGEAYGADAAAYTRAYAPNLAYEKRTLTLPVDFRDCRSQACSDAPDARGADVWRGARGGAQATVFTHVIDRRPSGPLWIQYWLYYPDSTWIHSTRAATHLPLVGGWFKHHLGNHPGDWESYQLRVDPDGRVYARASAHHGYSGHQKKPFDLNEAPNLPHYTRNGAWTPATGWTRVARGSHAGDIVDGAGDERRTESNGIRLVPIETLPPAARDRAFAISPPWEKRVYSDPEDTGT